MYPKNAASPEPIAIGAVVQISDGAVQTSGCTVRIKPVGVAEGDGAGTTSYSTDGIVYYTPTQAETNYTSFILIAKKTGCIPVAITVVTSNVSTAGKVDVQWFGGSPGTFNSGIPEVKVASIADGVITSAKFTVSAITGVATGILEMIAQLHRRFFKRVTKSATEIKTYADDGATVLTTQAYTSSGSNDEIGAAT